MQEFNKENYYKQGGSKLLQETVYITFQGEELSTKPTTASNT